MLYFSKNKGLILSIRKDNKILLCYFDINQIKNKYTNNRRF